MLARRNAGEIEIDVVSEGWRYNSWSMRGYTVFKPLQSSFDGSSGTNVEEGDNIESYS